MKTKFKSREAGVKDRRWYIIDAADKPLGRLAAKIASTLRGKHNAYFTPNQDTGDYVVVINIDKVKLSGNKLAGKLYHHHTGFIGGLKTETAGKMLARKPQKLLQLAVEGMMPKTALAGRQTTKLKIYKGADHPHKAQAPQELSL